MIAYYCGVPTPPFKFAYNDEDIEEADKILKYPMFVKHYNGYHSIGLSPKSKVLCRDDLFQMAKKTVSDYGGIQETQG